MPFFRSVRGMHPKDLNPRQGITTRRASARNSAFVIPSQRPQSPPGDYYVGESLAGRKYMGLNPKDLNPRQGITTDTTCLLVGGVGSIPKTSIPARGLLRDLRVPDLLGQRRIPKTSIPARGLLHLSTAANQFLSQQSQRPQSPPGDYYRRYCVD